MPIGADPTRFQQSLPARLLEATVLDPPTDDNGWLRVEIASQPGAAVSVPWTPRLDLSVMPGDAAVVEESDEGNYWCVEWWSQSGQVSVPPSVVVPATTTVLGVSKLSHAPADPAHPVVVETADPRMSDARTPLAHTHTEADVTGLATDLAARVQIGGDLGGTPTAPTVPGLAAKENAANKGVAGGYAPLDSGLLVPVANLPKLNAIGAPTGDVAFNGHKATGLADPTAAQDAATKNYVDTRPGTAKGARVGNTAAQNVNNNTVTVMTFNTTRYDTDAMTTTANRLIAKTAGIYGIGGVITWASNPNNMRAAGIRINGSLVIAWDHRRAGTNAERTNVATQYQLAVNDYIELLGYQDSGTNPLATVGETAGVDISGAAELWAVRVPG